MMAKGMGGVSVMKTRRTKAWTSREEGKAGSESVAILSGKRLYRFDTKRHTICTHATLYAMNARAAPSTGTAYTRPHSSAPRLRTLAADVVVGGGTAGMPPRGAP